MPFLSICQYKRAVRSSEKLVQESFPATPIKSSRRTVSLHSAISTMAHHPRLSAQEFAKMENLAKVGKSATEILGALDAEISVAK